MEKKNIIFNIITTIITIIIIIGLIFFVYNNFLKINSVNIDNISNLSSGDVYTLGKNKYSSLVNKNNIYTNGNIFFKNSNVDINNISNQDILYIAYSNLSLEDKNISGSASDDCFLNNNVYTKETYPSTCSIEKFDKKILEEQVNNFFSSNIKVEYTDFRPSASQICYLEDTYTCYLSSENVDFQNYLTLTSYSSAELEDNKLFVYSYLITIRKVGMESGIYSDANASNKIDDISSYYNITNDYITDDNTAKLINNYKDKISKYKSTFVLENNNYVWYSTEKVSE